MIALYFLSILLTSIFQLNADTVSIDVSDLNSTFTTSIDNNSFHFINKSNTVTLSDKVNDERTSLHLLLEETDFEDKLSVKKEYSIHLFLQKNQYKNIQKESSFISYMRNTELLNVPKFIWNQVFRL